MNRKAETVVDIAGTWNLTVKSPAGPMLAVLIIERHGESYTGMQSGWGMSEPVVDVKFDGRTLSWANHVRKPIKLTLQCAGTLDGHSISGKMKAGIMGSYAFSGTKLT